MAPSGQLTGFDVEVVQALSASLGMRLHIEKGSFSRLQELLQSGQLDLIGNQLLMVQENRRAFEFVRPYATMQLVCVQHEDDERDFLSLEDFVGRRLGVLKGTGIEEQALGVLGSSVKGFSHIEQALQALSQKQLDAVLEESLIADYYIEKNGLPLKSGAPFTAPQQAGLAVAKGQKALQKNLSDGVTALLRQPVFRQISSLWFGYDVSRARVAHSVAWSQE